MPAPQAPARKLGYQDYLAFPEDGNRHEILDGVHYVSPPPLDRHQRTLANLTFLFEVFLRRTRLGEVRFAPSEVRLADHDIVEPDLYIVLVRSLAGFHRRGFRAIPDLIVEVLSPGNAKHDLVVKLGRYEALGVPEYWIVDPGVGRIEIYRQETVEAGAPRRFARPLVVRLGRDPAIETPLIPGFSASLAEVFDPGLAGEGDEGGAGD